MHEEGAYQNTLKLKLFTPMRKLLIVCYQTKSETSTSFNPYTTILQWKGYELIQ